MSSQQRACPAQLSLNRIPRYSTSIATTCGASDSRKQVSGTTAVSCGIS